LEIIGDGWFSVARNRVREKPMPEYVEQNGQLGTIVSWRVPKEVPIQSLRDALRTAGLDEALAGDMEPRNALRRALRDMKEGRVIRKLRQDGDCLYFQFTREFLDEREIRYAKEAELCLHEPTGVVDCTEAEIEQTATKLLAEHIAKRLTSDLTRLVQRLYEARGADLIPIRPQGGAYFVPEMHADLVRSTKVLLDAIGGKLHPWAVRLGCGDTAASVADVMAEYLTELITEFRASCEDVDGGSRKDVQLRRQERIGELRQKLELYKSLLGAFAEKIGGVINKAEEELLKKLATGHKWDTITL